MKQLVRYFVRGTLVVVPVALTGWILYLVVTTADRLIPLGTPGVGVAATVALLIVVGFLASNVVGRTLFSLTDRFFARMPLIKLLYSSIKDLLSAAMGTRGGFDAPVAVELIPGSSVKALGFVTRQSATELGLDDHVLVYLPQSYNFAGNMLAVPRECVQRLDIGSAELMTLVVSGGIAGRRGP